MPYGSIFPVDSFFSSPLAVDLIHSGSTYKCIYSKTDISEEFNAENYEITVEVQAATALAIADGATVTINGISYIVNYSADTILGTSMLYLSKADVNQ